MVLVDGPLHGEVNWAKLKIPAQTDDLLGPASAETAACSSAATVACSSVGTAVSGAQGSAVSAEAVACSSATTVGSSSLLSASTSGAHGDEALCQSARRFQADVDAISDEDSDYDSDVPPFWNEQDVELEVPVLDPDPGHKSTCPPPCTPAPTPRLTQASHELDFVSVGESLERLRVPPQPKNTPLPEACNPEDIPPQIIPSGVKILTHALKVLAMEDDAEDG